MCFVFSNFNRVPYAYDRLFGRPQIAHVIFALSVLENLLVLHINRIAILPIVWPRLESQGTEQIVQDQQFFGLNPVFSESIRLFGEKFFNFLTFFYLLYARGAQCGSITPLSRSTLITY